MLSILFILIYFFIGYLCMTMTTGWNDLMAAANRLWQ